MGFDISECKCSSENRPSMSIDKICLANLFSWLLQSIITVYIVTGNRKGRIGNSGIALQMY